MQQLTSWMRALDESRAEKVTPVPGGVGVRHFDYPQAHDHNKLVITEPCGAASLVVSADRVLHDAAHRTIDVLVGADDLAAGLEAAGYAREDGVLMELVGAGVCSPVAEVLPLDVRCAVETDDWQRGRPEWDAETCRQLGERMMTAAPWATFLGARVDGAWVARADLYRRDSIAQIENVMTHEDFRGRGFASALVLDAAARADGHRVFLHADADDWPRELYRRLGFVDVGMIAAFTR